jgi:hypothetical protein
MSGNSTTKEKFPTERGFKLNVLATLIAAIAGLIYSIKQISLSFHHGEKLNQVGIDNLIDVVRMLDFVYVPFISLWLIYISIVMWLYYKKKHNDKT